MQVPLPSQAAKWLPIAVDCAEVTKLARPMDDA
jgi:hypothetical protein